MKGCILNVSYPFAIVSDFTAGGAEQILLALDNAIENAGYQSLVLAPRGSTVRGVLIESDLPEAPYTEENKARVYEKLQKRISSILEDYSVDLVHYHGIDFHYYLPEKKIPVLVTLHLPLCWYSEDAFIEAKKHNVVFNCVSYRQYMYSERLSEPFEFIENGVSLPAFPPVNKRGNYTVSMGRICPEKGFHLGMDASKLAGISHLLFGKVYPYPQHINYFHSHIVPRLDRRSRLFGQIGFQKRRMVLSSARCLLVPSLVEETSSLVAMEALACGTPVVAFKAGALIDIVQHNVNGFLVEDEEEMADAILKVSTLNAKDCYNTARTHYSKDRMTGQYLDLYEKILRRIKPVF
ncbi:MAG: glycosyltransferase family 4 protein [Fibrobacter sp.]|nr:glycosyltransferase family 4 protein [Fibrobacter sp.]